MLCYSGLGDEKLAKEHEARYMRFKADESSQAITGPYRQQHPEDNNERQVDARARFSAAAGNSHRLMCGTGPRLSSRRKAQQRPPRRMPEDGDDAKALA